VLNADELNVFTRFNRNNFAAPPSVDCVSYAREHVSSRLEKCQHREIPDDRNGEHHRMCRALRIA
jgi:hypothetical protein